MTKCQVLREGSRLRRASKTADNKLINVKISLSTKRLIFYCVIMTKIVFLEFKYKMKTNKITPYSTYQTSFQKRHIGKQVPAAIADTIRHATNLAAIEKKYAISFEKNPDDDYPCIARIILYLLVQRLRPPKTPTERLLAKIHKPTEAKKYKIPIVAKNDDGLCSEIQELNAEKIEQAIKADDERTARERALLAPFHITL